MALWQEKLFSRSPNQARARKKRNSRNKRLEKSKNTSKGKFFFPLQEGMYSDDICAAIKQKEFPSCHKIMHSNCSKGWFKAKGCKPIMILSIVYCIFMVDRRKVFTPYFQPRPLWENLTIANLRHISSRIWTCAEPELGLCWMKLCNSGSQDLLISKKIRIPSRADLNTTPIFTFHCVKLQDVEL